MTSRRFRIRPCVPRDVLRSVQPWLMAGAMRVPLADTAIWSGGQAILPVRGSAAGRGLSECGSLLPLWTRRSLLRRRSKRVKNVECVGVECANRSHERRVGGLLESRAGALGVRQLAAALDSPQLAAAPSKRIKNVECVGL